MAVHGSPAAMKKISAYLDTPTEELGRSCYVAYLTTCCSAHTHLPVNRVVVGDGL